MRDMWRQGTIVFLSIAQLITNAFGATGALPGSVEVGDISDIYFTAFTPADYTFAVWSPIYIGITLYAIYQALPAQRTRELHRRIGWWVALAALFNAVWTPIFTQQWIVASLPIIILLLVTLVAIFVQLREMDSELTTRDRWLVLLPFSLYAAWVSVATVANFATVGVALGVNNGGLFLADGLWATILVAVAGIISAGMLFYSRAGMGTIGYLLVILWALGGIFNEQFANTASIGYMAIVVAISLIVVTIVHFVNRYSQQNTQSRVTGTA